MRLPLAKALLVLPPAIAVGVSAACGGPAFTTAAGDAGTSTSPPIADAGADSSAGSFCLLEAGTHTFCDDFDGLPLATKWDSIDQAGGGTAVTDSTVSYSPPNSLKSVVPAGAGESHARVFKNFTEAASRVVVAFELHLDATPPELVGNAVGGDSLVGIQIGPNYSIGISAHTDKLAYFEDNSDDGGTSTPSGGNRLVATSTLTGWTEIVMTVDLASAKLSISIGGTQIVGGADITPPAVNAQTTISVILGAYAHNQTQSLAAHFDNATIDVTP